MLLVGVNVFRSHKLTYERGLAHASRTHQEHRMRRDAVATIVLLLLVDVDDRRGTFFGIVVPGQAVAPRPTFPERVSSVDDTWKCHAVVFQCLHKKKPQSDVTTLLLSLCRPNGYCVVFYTLCLSVCLFTDYDIFYLDTRIITKHEWFR